MPPLFIGTHVKLSILLAILGALIAFIFTLISGSGIMLLIVRPLVSALVMFILGTAIYIVFAKQVPEIIAELNPLQAEDSILPMDGEGVASSSDATEAMAAHDMGSTSNSDFDAVKVADPTSGSYSGMHQNPGKKNITAGPGEIVVEGVRIKNQPDVMAETIRHLMDQDED